MKRMPHIKSTVAPENPSNIAVPFQVRIWASKAPRRAGGLGRCWGQAAGASDAGGTLSSGCIPGPGVVVISSGGVAVGTALFADPYAPLKVRDGLRDIAARQGLDKVRSLTGAVRPW